MTHLVQTYGYWAVLVAVIAESLGVPLPAETVLVAAGVYAGQSHKLDAWVIFAVAVAGFVAGSMTSYLIGYKGGFALARRYGKTIRLDERKLKVGRYVLDRQGAKVIFFGRFVSVLRAYMSYIAGTVHMRWPKFTVATVVGVLVWSGLYTGLSYKAGNAFRHVSAEVAWILVAVALLVVLAVVLAVRRRVDTLAAKAEVAYPGPL